MLRGQEMPVAAKDTHTQLLPLDLCLAGASGEQVQAVARFSRRSPMVRRLCCADSARETISWLRGSRGPAVLLLDLVSGKPAEDFLSQLGCLCAEMDLVLIFLVGQESQDTFSIPACKVGGTIVRDEVETTLEKVLELISEYFMLR